MAFDEENLKRRKAINSQTCVSVWGGVALELAAERKEDGSKGAREQGATKLSSPELSRAEHCPDGRRKGR